MVKARGVCKDFKTTQWHAGEKNCEPVEMEMGLDLSAGSNAH